MPAYNSAKTIIESVDSIFNGNFEVGDELIIVNDGSTDDTDRIIKELKNKHPQIIYLVNPVNLGCPASRNIGIRTATNPLIFNIDSDNILVPGSVKKLKESLLAENADAAAFGEYHFFQTNPKKITHKCICRPGIMTLADFLAGPRNPGPGGNYLYTKASWQKIGGYWEYGYGLHEAWGFTLKQLANGAKFVIVPGTFYFHRYGWNSLTIRETKNKEEFSLMASKMIMPFLDLLSDEDANLIKSETGSRTWFGNFSQRPLRLKNGQAGQTGKDWRNLNLLGRLDQRFPGLFKSLKSFLATLRKKIKLLKYFISGKKIDPSEKWLLDEGDKRLRFSYKLNSASIAFDIGGYEGEWADIIFHKYGCNVFIFEPIKEFAENIKQKFLGNDKIKVYNLGLAGETKDTVMSYNHNSSSIFAGNQAKETVKLKKISDFLRENKIERVDLMKINIEGGEYEILEDMIKNNLIKNVKNIQVQFHNFFPEAESRMEKIQAELAKTHRPTYQYKFVWENWKIL